MLVRIPARSVCNLESRTLEMVRKMGGNLLLKLNIDSRPIANKYREGKMKRTLKRELKVPEIAEREANETSCLLLDCHGITGSASTSLRVVGVVEGDFWGVSCGLLST